MKNLAKSAGLLFVALGALCLTSCTKNEDLKADLKPKATAFASATVQLQTEKATNPTGKQVERGTLFAWIKDVNITVSSLDWAYAPSFTPFQLVDINNNNTNNINYVIDNVAIGNNHFDVVTTTSTVPALSFTNSGTLPTTLMTTTKAISPYAIYHTNFNAVVSNNGQLTPNYAQTLLTDHGRGIGVFSIGSDLGAMGGSAVVSVIPNPMVQGVAPITVSTGNNGLFYVSKENSTGGESVTFSVQIRDAHNVNVGTPFTTTMNIIKSTSVNNSYVINKTGIVLNQTLEQFVAEPWNNIDTPITIGN